MSFGGQQLTLPVQLRNDASFDHFLQTPNEKIVSLLKDCLDIGNETLTFISGAKESGKTFLCSAAVNYAESRGKTVGYFSMTDLIDLPLEQVKQALFDGTEDIDILFLEDIDRWLEAGEREIVLFNLFNQFKMSSQQLILTARTSPSNLEVDLPDLHSRLQSGLTLTLTILSDEDKEAILRHSALARGINVNEDVSAFIIRRSGRNMGQLFTVLDMLDRASLTEKRRITVPFVKKVMDW